MFNTLAMALLPVAFLMALGWLSGHRGYFKRDDVSIFATLVMRYALPFSLFLGALKTPPEKLTNIPFILTMLTGLMGTYLLALAGGLLLFRYDMKKSAVQALVCAFPDMAYFGAPILAAVCGPSGFLAVLVGNLITSIFMLPLTIILTRYGETASQSQTDSVNVPRVLACSIGKAVTNQMVWLPVLGACLSFAGVHLPDALEHSVDLVARCAGGVSLLALGLMFYGERPTVNRDVVANVGLKNFLQPALMLAGVLLFKCDADFARQALITGAVPTAIAASMYAIRNGTYAMEASDSVVIGTALGLLSEALLIGMI